MPCDAAADIICHFPSQGQCCRDVQWAYKSDNREKQRERFVCAHQKKLQVVCSAYQKIKKKQEME